MLLQVWSGAVRRRKGETTALNTAEENQRGKKARTALFSCFSVLFFIYTTQKSPWRCHKRACTGPALGRCKCVWGGAYFLPSASHTLSSRTLLQGWSWLPLSCYFSSSRLRVCRTVRLAGGGQGLVDGWLEAAHVLHGGTICLYGLHVLVQDGKNLIVQDLVLPDPICHFLQGLQRRGTCRLGMGVEDT